MKLSQFNSIIPLNNKLQLVYNAYSNRFIIISSKIKYLNDLNLIQRNKSLYNILKQTLCIVNDDLDEIELIKKLQKKCDEDNTFFHLTINPTLNCNFKCWYCYETHISKSSINNKTLNAIKKLITNIITKQIQLTNLSLNFFGGEPFLCFDRIKEIILFTKNICKSYSKDLLINFTTNGFLLSLDTIEWLSNQSISSMQITLDGNREKHNKVRSSNEPNGSYDKIITNVKTLLEKQINVILRINYTTNNILGLENILDDISTLTQNSKELIEIQFHKVWQASEEANNKIDSVINNFVHKGFIAHKYPLNNVISSCYADKMNGALINYNGDVFRCTAINFSKQQRDGYLNDNGIIIWENNSNVIRRNIKFQNKPCLNCRILPICNGGCSQKALEYKDQDYCILGYDESKKDDAIINRLKDYLLFNPNFTFTEQI